MDETPGKTRRQRRPRKDPAGLAAVEDVTAPDATPATGEPRGDSQSDPEQLSNDATGLTGAHPVVIAEEPAPNPLATTWTELDLRCPTCSIIHYVPVCLFLNVAESPHLDERLRKGQFNRKRCPMCRKIEPVEHPYTYYDPSRQLAVQVRPEWEFKAGGGEEWYAARLEDFFEQWQDRDVRIDVVFGEEQLLARYLNVADSPE